MDRLLESAGKGFRDQRCDGVNRRKNFLEKASWRSFPFKWFKHAPFEVEQLRSDVPEAIVKNTRFYRDHSTLNSLFTMMEVKHPYRPKIEARMLEIVSHYNPHK
ncbi:hypothetical protein AGDE_05700 [Angomonas deanei]|nr:hypothetical protein AGDE_05700 [Angomonas deanei]|eukprot:EPY38231.1 hypothetical protein AGDE_05700 [Angomonas deanei]